KGMLKSGEQNMYLRVDIAVLEGIVQKDHFRLVLSDQLRYSFSSLLGYRQMNIGKLMVDLPGFITYLFRWVTGFGNEQPFGLAAVAPAYQTCSVGGEVPDEKFYHGRFAGTANTEVPNR